MKKYLIKFSIGTLIFTIIAVALAYFLPRTNAIKTFEDMLFIEALVLFMLAFLSTLKGDDSSNIERYINRSPNAAMQTFRNIGAFISGENAKFNLATAIFVATGVIVLSICLILLYAI